MLRRPGHPQIGRKMNAEEANPRIVLGRDEPLLARLLLPEEALIVTDGVGTTIRINSGEVLITEENGFIGHILGASQEYTIDRAGRAMVISRTASSIGLFV